MKPAALEWVSKAEAEFALVQREIRVRRAPNFDAVCFHAQQCVEKYLKACLQEWGIAFPKTHDLVFLLSLAVAREPLWQPYSDDMMFLTGFAVLFRYPGYDATPEMAKDAVRRCRTLRNAVRFHLGMEAPKPAARRKKTRPAPRKAKEPRNKKKGRLTE